MRNYRMATFVSFHSPFFGILDPYKEFEGAIDRSGLNPRLTFSLSMAACRLLKLLAAPPLTLSAAEPRSLEPFKVLAPSLSPAFGCAIFCK